MANIGGGVHTGFPTEQRDVWLEVFDRHSRPSDMVEIVATIRGIALITIDGLLPLVDRILEDRRG